MSVVTIRILRISRLRFLSMLGISCKAFDRTLPGMIDGTRLRCRLALSSSTGILGNE
jgi:hypothetical protein